MTMGISSSATSSTRTSAGFTMVQDTREHIAATLLALSLLTERTMQHEADKDTDVPFARYELRAVQEDGNIRPWPLPTSEHHILIYCDPGVCQLLSERNQPPNAK